MISFYNAQGQRISNTSIDMTGLKLLIPAPRYETTSIDAEGGEIILDRRLLSRPLVGEFFTKSIDYKNSLDLRDILYALFSSGQEIYVAEGPKTGKRWKVYTGDWEVERVNAKVLRASIPLTAPTGLAESINIVTRNYKTPSVLFDNQGNVIIDMRKQRETEIIFEGASTGLAITNETTGDVWKYTGSTTVGDTILLKGVQSFKNGVSIFRDTNKKLLTFAPGVNKLTISGAESVNLTIRTRFYFL